MDGQDTGDGQSSKIAQSQQRWPTDFPCGNVDFRLIKEANGRCSLSALSCRGRTWLRFESGLTAGEQTFLSLSEANVFLRKARKQELRTEYVGPVSVLII